MPANIIHALTEFGGNTQTAATARELPERYVGTPDEHASIDTHALSYSHTQICHCARPRLTTTTNKTATTTTTPQVGTRAHAHNIVGSLSLCSYLTAMNIYTFISHSGAVVMMWCLFDRECVRERVSDFCVSDCVSECVRHSHSCAQHHLALLSFHC